MSDAASTALQGLGFRVAGLRVWNVGVEGLRLRVQGSWRDEGGFFLLGFRVEG